MTGNRQENLLSRLRAVWWRGQMLQAAAGALAFVRWAIPLFLTAIVIDWLVDLPALLRGLVVAAVLGVSAYKAWRAGWAQLGAFSAAHTALHVEQRLGGLESLLVTAVQLGLAESPGGTSGSLRDVTLQRAEQAAGTLRAREIVSFQVLRRPTVAALVVALLIGACAFTAGPLLIAGAARLFAPWLAVQYPTRTHLDLANGDMVVKEGDRAHIEARVSGVIPSRARLALRTGTGASRVHEIDITDGRCVYTMESVFRGFEYQVIAGDARSEWHTVQVIPPPRIERAEVRLEFPAYTQRPVETGEALTVSVPENTGVQWRLTLDRPVSGAAFTTGDEPQQPMEVSEDGRVVTMQRVATESRAYNFAWVEREHGFSFTSPRYYVQVAPDQKPGVELTSPRADLYATLGRKLDLAFRGRDDYGIGDAAITYHLNKSDEVKVPFPAPAVHDGSEQSIDWDYRTVLPDLAVGDSVSFAIELTDRYPGPNGPHRARSDVRRITFLSQEQYLEHIARQKQRLLTQLQTIYREERSVHDLVRQLDPQDDVFVQTCQLEAVRQDLMRERLGRLSGEMKALIDDLAANNISDESRTTVLAQLAAAIQVIADEHVGAAANNLRALASVSGSTADPAPAIAKVNSAARELGLLVLELGYRDAAEVMARELHATAQTQASLRSKTLLPGSAASAAPEALADAQEQLRQWTTRLLAATPREQESTPADALVAFGLTRLSKQLLAAGVDAGMSESAALIRSGGATEASRRQAEVIQALLRAEFRLRFGSEYEALSKARAVFLAQAERQKALHAEIAAFEAEEFKRRVPDLARSQRALQRNLQLVLMPAVPASQPRMLDVDAPPAPPVNDLLSAAERAMSGAAGQLESGDRDSAAAQQKQAADAVDALAEIARRRIESMTQTERLASFMDLCAEGVARVGQFKERQLGLLEKTDAALSDKASAAYLADPQQKLLEDVSAFRSDLLEKSVELGMRPEDVGPLHSALERVVQSMGQAAQSLRTDQASQALAQQQAATEAFAEADAAFADDASRLGAFAKVVGDAEAALAPGPYVTDIESEQLDLIAATRKAKPEEMASLVMPQKNLVHAVNAVLSALDVLAHKVDSGTGMLFAKTDMDSAAIALEDKDSREAVDAQTAVADTMRDLQLQLHLVTPQYTYVREIAQFVHESLPEVSSLRVAQTRLAEKASSASDAPPVSELEGEQRALEARARAYGDLLFKATGEARFQRTAKLMADAADRLKAGDKSAALPLMRSAAEALQADRTELLTLMQHLGVVLGPPVFGREPKPEVALLLNVLPVAAAERSLGLESRAAAPDDIPGLATEQREVLKQLEALVGAPDAHPKLVEAKQQLTAAAATLEKGPRDEALARQQQGIEALRHFVIEYVTKHVELPPPAPPQPPAPTDEPGEEMDVSIFMPGAVSGKLPKTGRVEWEVLGRRERAALNENFARELPLEYRAILKDYYERLTR